MSNITKYIAYCLLPITYCLLPIFSFAQVSNTFMRTVTAAGMNGGLSLAETRDDGFVGTGQHGTSGAGSCDVYVYKVDACGYPEWYKTYGSGGEDGGYSIEQTSDGGYIVTGLTAFGSGAYDILLLKIDALGNVQWSKAIGGGGDDFGLRVRQTTDGGYIFSGFITGMGYGAQDISLIKTDSLGNVLWKKIYGGAGGEWGNYVEQTSDKGFMVMGYTTSFGAGGFDIYLLKTDSLGNLQFSKTYGGPGGEASSQWGLSGKVTTDGGFMLCANTNSWGAGSNDYLLIKTDSLGNLKWAKTYGGLNDDEPRFALETRDKGYILSGYTTSFGNGGLDAYLIKTDTIGTLQWSRAYGSTGSDRGSMVAQAADGGYALSTVTSSFGAIYFDALFMKTDSMGILGCYENACATVVNTVTPIVGSGGNEMISPAIETPLSIIAGTYTPIDNFVCRHCITVPAFTPSDTTVCVGQTMFFYNTTTVGLRCFEDWYVNGTLVTGDKDTLPFIFNTAGIQNIQLISSCGNSTDTSTVHIYVFDYPVAAFSNTTECNGSATQFTNGSSIPSGSISLRVWNFGDGSPPDTTQNPSHTFANAGMHTVTFIVSNSVGCADTITKPVQVYYKPTAGFTHTDVCFRDSLYFTNTSSVDTSTSIAAYLWVFGDGSVTSSLKNPSHYYSLHGTYNVTLVTTTADGCADAVSNPVNVFDPPQNTFTFSNTCLFASAVFTNTTVNPTMGSTASWSWNFGDSSPLNTSVWSPQHLYTAPGNYPVTLITHSSNLGCPDTLQQTITVFPMPVAKYSFTNVCLNQPMNFYDSSTVSSGSIASRAWNFGDGTLFSTLQNPSHTYANPGTYFVTLIVTTNNNCKDTIADSVVVHPLPIAQFSRANVCDGTPVQFTNLSTILPTDTIQTWAWNFGDNSPVNNIPSPSHLLPAYGSYSVKLLVVSYFGCADSITKTSVINPNPVLLFGANPEAGCEPLCVNFQDLSIVATGGIVQWSWNPGDGSPVSTSQDFAHCYITNSVYTPDTLNVSLTIASDSGCVTSGSKNNYITVYPNPNASFRVQPQTTTIIDPIISIIDLSTGADYWYWNFGDNDTTSQHNPVPHTYKDTGTYTIMLITSTQYNCKDTTYQTVIIEPDFIFYVPNSFSPNDDGINDTFTGKGIFIKEFELTIYDRWGNLIFFSDDKDKAWDGKANHGNEMAQRDVYVYSFKVTDYKRKKHSYKGVVTLVR